MPLQVSIGNSATSLFLLFLVRVHSGEVVGRSPLALCERGKSMINALPQAAHEQGTDPKLLKHQ